MSLKQNTTTKVAVLYGGFSAEHEISLLSAARVIKNLDKRKFDIIPIGIDNQGHCFLNELQSLYSKDTILLKTKNSQSFSGLSELMGDKKAWGCRRRRARARASRRCASPSAAARTAPA